MFKKRGFMMKWLLLVSVFVFSALLVPLIILFCRKYKIFDPVNARKIHSGEIPRLGGVAIVLSFLAGFLIYCFALKGLPVNRCVPLIVAGSIIFLFGFFDDLFEFRAIFKLVVQIIAVAIVVFSGYRFTRIMNWEMPLWFSYVLSFGWVLGIVNAYNLIDGLDGLCGGLSFLTLVTLGICLLLVKDSAGIICLYLAVAILGFLLYNWPPAKIFMGDCGSQFLGFMIAVIPLYSTVENFEYNKLFIMLVLVSIPMFDTIAAIWRRLRDHRPIMSPDKMHLHHKLMNLGLSKKETLIMLLLIQLLLCLAVCSTVYITRSRGAVVLILAYIFMAASFCVLHYLHRAVLKKHGEYGQAISELTEKQE